MHDDISRRRFLHGSALGLGGVLLASCGGRSETGDTARATRSADTAGAGGAPGRVAHIGLQLYTIRDLVKTDMQGALRAIAGVGYREVEMAGLHGNEPAEVRRMLDEAGLVAPSGHAPIEALRTELDAAIAAAEVLGHRYLILPWLQPPKSLDAWRSLARELGVFGRACRQRNIQFAYHNHDFEFAPIDGTMPYDLLLAECDPELVKMEMDLFWTVKGGQDPVAYFERHPGRFPLVHVKDMREPQGAQEMVDVGSGDIDFPRIFAHAERAGLEHYVVEHDNPANPIASVRASYAHLREILA